MRESHLLVLPILFRQLLSVVRAPWSASNASGSRFVVRGTHSSYPISHASSISASHAKSCSGSGSAGYGNGSLPLNRSALRCRSNNSDVFMSYSYKLETQKQPTPSDEGARYEKQDKVPKRNYETRFHKPGSGGMGRELRQREIVRERFRI